MMLLLPGNARAIYYSLSPNPSHYGWLLTPQRTMTKTAEFVCGFRYAVDNECFCRPFDGERFLRGLERIRNCHGFDGCLFVVAPDVVGNAEATLESFSRWQPRIRAEGFPVALAAQDGLESLPVPWDAFDALFIGGSTAWKLGRQALALRTEAKVRGKWVHIGRVNSVKRASRIIGPCDSIDGTAWARHPANYCRQWQLWLEAGKPKFNQALL